MLYKLLATDPYKTLREFTAKNGTPSRHSTELQTQSGLRYGNHLRRSRPTSSVSVSAKHSSADVSSKAGRRSRKVFRPSPTIPSDADKYVNELQHMLKSRLWKRINPLKDRMLCLPCAEKRLDRPFSRRDFKKMPVNAGQAQISPELAARPSRES